MTQPSPSNAATANAAPLKEAPMVIVGRALAERGHYGFVWIDDEFTVTAKYGRLVDFVTVGDGLMDDLPPLAGLEPDIRRLKNRDHAILELPAVAIVSAASSTPRLNLLVMWISEQSCYLCLVMRTRVGSSMEIELAKEIRRRLIAESEVQAKSRELARANQDLEDYASVISHDLQAPMRALRYQVDELESALGASLSDEIAGQLDTLRGQTRRMSNMLMALLEYASIGRKSQALSTVETRELVNAIVSSLGRKPDQHIEVTGSWPSVRTLEQPLDLVLRNLIDNAVKHHIGGDVAVNVSCEETDDHLEITVSDNGPGIAPEHRKVIFLPFRTVHNSGDSEEVSGLGLAVVHRIVEDVGGKIQVEGRADGREGAVFRVLWPKTILD